LEAPVPTPERDSRRAANASYRYRDLLSGPSNVTTPRFDAGDLDGAWAGRQSSALVDGDEPS
jgi:hypothetical protein